MIRVRHRRGGPWWAARVRPGDDRGSLVFALLASFIGMGLAAVLTPIIVTQWTSTTVDDNHASALGAAQAGLEVAFGQINAAASVVSGTRVGDVTKLPCGPLTGTVSTGNGSSYSVKINYFATDPSGTYFTSSDAAIDAADIPCSSGSGTATTPGFALLRAQGSPSSSQTSRTLVATYTFRLGAANLPGGLIHVFQDPGGPDLCFDAGTGNPAPGTALHMQLCSPGAPQQSFAYNPDLTLQLVSSKTASKPQGLCLDAGGYPHKAGALVLLQYCGTTTQPQQQWSLNTDSNFQGTASNGKDVDSSCFNVQSPNTPGSLVVLGTTQTNGCEGSLYNNPDVEAFSPEASVGAGAAGAATGQVVNYDQFGRCLDVTNLDPNSTFLISWPCKQSPDPTKLDWNQLWNLPSFPAGAVQSSPGHITTTTNNTTYCLLSPLSTASGTYVVVKPCSGATTAAYNWTVYGDTGRYATSYVIKDSAGNCMAPSPTDMWDNGSYQTSKIIMAACDGSDLQKWNAPAQDPHPLGNIGER